MERRCSWARWAASRSSHRDRAAAGHVDRRAERLGRPYLFRLEQIAASARQHPCDETLPALVRAQPR
eukprot:506221-Prymnesium_polylepis.1